MSDSESVILRRELKKILDTKSCLVKANTAKDQEIAKLEAKLAYYETTQHADITASSTTRSAKGSGRKGAKGSQVARGEDRLEGWQDCKG